MTRKLHPCARTNAALRREIQESSETNKALAVRLGLQIRAIIPWFGGGGWRHSGPGATTVVSIDFLVELRSAEHRSGRAGIAGLSTA